MLVTCDCSSDVDEVCKCCSEIIRKARKPHECCECGDTIPAGKRYEEATGIDSAGEPFRYRTCIGCRNLRRHYCSGGWFWGGLREALMECESVGFDYTLPPSELVVEDEETR